MTSPESITGPLNLGNPHEFTISDLAELEITLVGSKSKLSYPLPTEYPKQCKPGLDKTTKLIDWKPRTQLIFGLQKTIPYFDQLLRQGFKSKTWSSK
jgi:UDP-glucuronate decarboxylase